ncbi:MAG: carbohydrate binding family 9 domain-containing protein [Candidatus Marinimicrobia bacterium]|nr:carbohydrate binding family 9 domain-containing protein [Candidatus Neomarinimicrobiota bacterium]
MRKIFIFIIGFTIMLNASLAKKEIKIRRLANKPILDGKLEDEFWKDLPALKDFIQFTPYNGKSPSQPSLVKIGYDDEAIYIGAQLCDASPDSIFNELSRRDENHNINTDELSIFLNPFNDGINSYYFTVTAAGVQSDTKITGEERDDEWDAVWSSKVDINKHGWSAEIVIPYSSIRFPSKNIQKWGFNVFRTIKRYGEQSVWSYINRDTQRWWKEEQGTIKNIKEIKPPLRLSFTPYLSSYFQKEGQNTGYSYTGGLDLKYGINESFTLNMTLIPDFGQVQADNDVLNLSPFERHHRERRPFFTEATQLFNKGDIFYSRRIGGEPEKYSDIENTIGEQDTILSNPDKTQLINAVKLNGRTDNGLGIGVLNAITDKTTAKTKNLQTDEITTHTTQPLTNYNVLVFDKSLRRNSFLNITNANKYNSNYISNVTSSSLILENGAGYNIGGYAALSQQFYPDSTSSGWRLKLNSGKTKGSYQYNYRITLVNDSYNPNDLGFLRRNNEIEHELRLEYNQYDPIGPYLDIYHTLDIEYGTLFSPYEFTDFRIGYHSFRTFKNHNSLFFRTTVKPVKGFDYYEPRQDGMFFITPRYIDIFTGFFQDDRRKLFLEFRAGSGKAFSDFSDKYHYFLSFQPNLRINSKMRMNYDIRYRKRANERGWADEEDHRIIFGKRDIRTVTNTMNFGYIFNNTSSLDFRFRHYWSTVDYFKFYKLQNNGYLFSISDYYENRDINYNSINLRMNFLWRFAPGSELSLVWQKQVYSERDNVNVSMYRNLRNTFNADQLDSISMKILYYLDYLKLFG